MADNQVVEGQLTDEELEEFNKIMGVQTEASFEAATPLSSEDTQSDLSEEDLAEFNRIMGIDTPTKKPKETPADETVKEAVKEKELTPEEVEAQALTSGTAPEPKLSDAIKLPDFATAFEKSVEDINKTPVTFDQYTRLTNEEKAKVNSFAKSETSEEALVSGTVKGLLEQKRELQLPASAQISTNEFIRGAFDSEVLSGNRSIPLEGYLNDLIKSNPGKYTELATKSKSIGKLSQKEQYGLLSKALTDKLNKNNFDLNVVSDRGIIDEYKKIAPLKEQLKQLNTVIDDFSADLTKQGQQGVDPAALDPLRDKLNILIENKKRTEADLNKIIKEAPDGAIERVNYFEAKFKDSEARSKELSELHKEFPELVASEAQQEKINKAYDNAFRSSTEEPVIRLWNSAVDLVSGMVHLSKLGADIVQPFTDENVHTTSDRMIEGFDKFVESFVKLGVSDKPFVSTDKKGDTHIHADRFLPALATTVGDMAGLIYGGTKYAKVLGGSQKLGMFASSFTTMYDNNYKENLEKGLSPFDANQKAISETALLSVIEAAFPEISLMKSQSARKSIAKIIKDTQGSKYKRIAEILAVQPTIENVEEFTQSIAEKAINAVSNKVYEMELGEDKFETSFSSAEIQETAILTTAATLLLGGISPSVTKGVRKHALNEAATRFDKFKEDLERQVEDGTMTQKQATSVLKDVEEFRDAKKAVPADLDLETTLNAAELKREKTKLEGEIKTLDENFTQKQKERIIAIDAELAAIAGVKPEAAPTGKAPEAAVPPVGKKPEAKAEPTEKAPEKPGEAVEAAPEERFFPEGMTEAQRTIRHKANVKKLRGKVQEAEREQQSAEDTVKSIKDEMESIQNLVEKAPEGTRKDILENSASKLRVQLKNAEENVVQAKEQVTEAERDTEAEAVEFKEQAPAKPVAKKTATKKLTKEAKEEQSKAIDLFLKTAKVLSGRIPRHKASMEKSMAKGIAIENALEISKLEQERDVDLENRGFDKDLDRFPPAFSQEVIEGRKVIDIAKEHQKSLIKYYEDRIAEAAGQPIAPAEPVAKKPAAKKTVIPTPPAEAAPTAQKPPIEGEEGVGLAPQKPTKLVSATPANSAKVISQLKKGNTVDIRVEALLDESLDEALTLAEETLGKTEKKLEDVRKKKNPIKEGAQLIRVRNIKETIRKIKARKEEIEKTKKAPEETVEAAPKGRKTTASAAQLRNMAKIVENMTKTDKGKTLVTLPYLPQTVSVIGKAISKSMAVTADIIDITNAAVEALKETDEYKAWKEGERKRAVELVQKRVSGWFKTTAEVSAAREAIIEIVGADANITAFDRSKHTKLFGELKNLGGGLFRMGFKKYSAWSNAMREALEDVTIDESTLTALHTALDPSQGRLQRHAAQEAANELGITEEEQLANQFGDDKKADAVLTGLSKFYDTDLRDQGITRDMMTNILYDAVRQPGVTYTNISGILNALRKKGGNSLEVMKVLVSEEFTDDDLRELFINMHSIIRVEFFADHLTAGKYGATTKDTFKSNKGRGHLELLDQMSREFVSDAEYVKKFESYNEKRQSLVKGYGRLVKAFALTPPGIIGRPGDPKAPASQERIDHARRLILQADLDFMQEATGLDWLPYLEKYYDHTKYNSYEEFLITTSHSDFQFNPISLYVLGLGETKNPLAKSATILKNIIGTDNSGQLGVLNRGMILLGTSQQTSNNFTDVAGNKKTSFIMRSHLSDRADTIHENEDDFYKDNKLVQKHKKSGKPLPIMWYEGMKDNLRNQSAALGKLTAQDKQLSMLFQFVNSKKDEYMQLVDQFSDKKSMPFIPVDKLSKDDAKKAVDALRKSNRDNVEHFPKPAELNQNFKDIMEVINKIGASKLFPNHIATNIEDIVATYVLNFALNKFESDEYFHGRAARYKSHTDATKRGGSIVSSGKELDTDVDGGIGKSFSQIVLNDPLVSLKSVHPDMDPKGKGVENTDGVMWVSETMAEKLRVSGGTMNLGNSTKPIISYINENGDRVLNKMHAQVATKEMAERFPGYKEVYDLFEKHKVDTIIYTSGAKVIPPNEVSENASNPKIIERPTKAFRVQLDLRGKDSNGNLNHKMKSLKLGTQMLKHMLTFNSGSAGQAIINSIASDNFKSMFTDLGTMSGEDKRAILLENIADNDKNAEVREMIANGTSLLHPYIASFITKVLVAQIKKKITGLKGSGTILTTISNMGEDLKPLRVEFNGKELTWDQYQELSPEDMANAIVHPAEVLVPEDSDMKVGDEIFITRIPSDDKHSTVLAIVKGLTPANMGNVIVLDPVTRAMTGEDLDGDQRRVWGRSKGKDGKKLPSDANSKNHNERMNALFDLYADEYRDASNYGKIIRPVSAEKIAPEAKENRNQYLESSLIKAYKDNRDGQETIGPAARAISTYIHLAIKNVVLKRGLKFPVFENGKQTENSTEATKFVPVDDTMEDLGNLLNIIVDAAKFQQLRNLGLINYTVNVYFGLRTVGVPLEDIKTFFSSPAIKEFVEFADNLNSVSEAGDTFKAVSLYAESLQEGSTFVSYNEQHESGAFAIARKSQKASPGSIPDVNFEKPSLNDKMRILAYYEQLHNTFKDFEVLNQNVKATEDVAATFNEQYKMKINQDKIDNATSKDDLSYDATPLTGSEFLETGKHSSAIINEYNKGNSFLGTKLFESLIKQLEKFTTEARSYRPEGQGTALKPQHLSSKQTEGMDQAIEAFAMLQALNATDRVDTAQRTISGFNALKGKGNAFVDMLEISKKKLGLKRRHRNAEIKNMKEINEAFEKLPDSFKQLLAAYNVYEYGYSMFTGNGAFSSLFGDQFQIRVGKKLEQVRHKWNTTQQGLTREILDQIIDVNPSMLPEVNLVLLEKVPGGQMYINGKNTLDAPARVIAKSPNTEKMTVYQRQVKRVAKGESYTLATGQKTTAGNDTIIYYYTETTPEGASPTSFTVKNWVAPLIDPEAQSGADVQEDPVNELKFQEAPAEAFEEAASSDPELADYMMARINKLFPGVKIFTNREEFLEYVNKHVGPGKTVGDFGALGAAFADAIFIDPEAAVQSTALHELAHLYWDALPKDHPTKKAMLAIFKDTKNPEEAAIQAIGLAGVDIAKVALRGSALAKFKAVMKRFWSKVKAFFGKGVPKGSSAKVHAQILADSIWHNDAGFSATNFRSRMVKFQENLSRMNNLEDDSVIREEVLNELTVDKIDPKRDYLKLNKEEETEEERTESGATASYRDQMMRQTYGNTFGIHARTDANGNRIYGMTKNTFIGELYAKTKADLERLLKNNPDLIDIINDKYDEYQFVLKEVDKLWKNFQSEEDMYNVIQDKARVNDILNELYELSRTSPRATESLISLIRDRQGKIMLLEDVQIEMDPALRKKHGLPKERNVATRALHEILTSSLTVDWGTHFFYNVFKSPVLNTTEAILQYVAQKKQDVGISTSINFAEFHERIDDSAKRLNKHNVSQDELIKTLTLKGEGKVFIAWNGSFHKKLKEEAKTDKKKEAMVDFYEAHINQDRSMGSPSFIKGQWRVPQVEADIPELTKQSMKSLGFIQGAFKTVEVRLSKDHKYDDMMVETASIMKPGEKKFTTERFITIEQAKKHIENRHKNAKSPLAISKKIFDLRKLNSVGKMMVKRGIDAAGNAISPYDPTEFPLAADFEKKETSSKNIFGALIKHHYGVAHKVEVDAVAPILNYIQDYSESHFKSDEVSPMAQWLKATNDGFLYNKVKPSGLLSETPVLESVLEFLVSYTYLKFLSWNVGGMKFNAAVGLSQSAILNGFRNSLRGATRIVSGFGFNKDINTAFVQSTAIHLMQVFDIVNTTQSSELSVSAAYAKRVMDIGMFNITSVEYINHAYSFIGLIPKEKWAKIVEFGPKAKVADILTVLSRFEIAKLQHATQLANGTYSTYAKPFATKYLEGRLFSTFRGWVGSFLKALVSREKRDMDGIIRKGMYRTLIGSEAGKLYLGIAKNPMSPSQWKKKWKGMKEVDRRNFVSATRQLLIISAWALLYLDIDEEDEDAKAKKKTIRRFMSDLMPQTDPASIGFFLSIPALRPAFDLIKLIAEIFAVVTPGVHPAQYHTQKFDPLTGELLQDVGDYKLPGMLLDAFPVARQFFDPEDVRVEGELPPEEI